MAEDTTIEWCDHTFNPWEGCQKVSPGCDHCYAETRNARFNGTAVNWGPHAPRRRTSAANWKKPLKWNREAEAFFLQHGRRQRVFCASLADVFDNAVDPEWRMDLFRLIAQTPDLDWLLLTKRIGNVPAMVDAIGSTSVACWNTDEHGLDDLAPNVWLGITVVNQEEADRDIPKLLAIDASVRFLSMEPLLGPVDLLPFFDPTGACCGGEPESRCEGCPSDAPWRYSIPSDDGQWAFDPTIDWVIVGGESGPGARPMHPDWARAIREQCLFADVPFLFKQWGEWAIEQPETPLQYLRKWAQEQPGQDQGPCGTNERLMAQVGKKAAGRLLDGVEHNGFPEASHG